MWASHATGHCQATLVRQLDGPFGRRLVIRLTYQTNEKYKLYKWSLYALKLLDSYQARFRGLEISAGGAHDAGYFA
jgi:hypothetical protein